ncbi:MAG: hypothetical protein RJA44_2430 [Pseudomonadota bacterium]|jgi:phasin family protein
MNLSPEQFTAAGQAQLEALIGLQQKSFEGLEKIVALNLQIVRAAVEDSAQYTKALLAAKDAQEVLALQNGFVQPASEKALDYSRQVYEIAAATQAEVSKLAEAQATELQQKFQSMFEGALKGAPAGSESAVALLQSAMTAANSAIENVQKAAKQAVASAEANVKAVAPSKAASRRAPSAS